MSRKRRAAARARPVERATSLSVRVGLSASKARITARPRCSDCTKSVSRSARPIPVWLIVSPPGLAASSSRSVRSSSSVGGAVVSSVAARRRSQPVAALTSSTSTPGVHVCEHEFSGNRVRLEHAQVGDHRGRPSSSEAQAAAFVASRAVPERGDEVEPLDEPFARLADDDDYLWRTRLRSRARRRHPGGGRSGASYDAPIVVVLMLAKRSIWAAPRKPTSIRPGCSQ